MRIKILLPLLLTLLPGFALAGESRILSMSGTVEARQTREGQWVPAAENMEIAEGGAVRTGADGGAVLLMPNKTKVWMKEGSSLELEQRQTLASRLALVFGRIKVRVPHLMRKEKFEVRTPAAVCAVRGTEFTMGTNEEGKMELQVLFGEVKLKFVVPPEKGASEFSIPQGQGLSLEEKGKPTKPVLLTAAKEREAMENWNPGLKQEERGRELQQKENDRAQVKEFARVSNNTDSEVKSFVNVVKESDLEAGRTLTDVHGNLVRVDQRMMRPAADEIQFFNLVKRPTYASYTAATEGFAYNGGAMANRLDYMQMTMNFNKDLPQRIEEWPGFFNGNSVKAEWASFIMANRTLSDEIFFVGQGYKYDATRDELMNNTGVVGLGTLSAPTVDRNVIITGVIKDEAGVSAIAGLGRITNLDFTDAGASNGTLKYGDNTAVNGLGSNVVWAVMTDNSFSYSEPKDRADGAPLVQYQADMYAIGNGATKVWFAKENYVIGNGGGIRTPGDFTNSSSDPFSLLKDNALESVMYIKKSNGAAPNSITSSTLAKADILGADYFSYNGGGAGVGTNIDIVFIPDLMVAAVQRMLPAITNLKD
ncbi:MAG: FecR domain-containing protein [Elusimicrobia bacterium]|nr:FecR domain-containing protein [Elusimicrobiota bacterium]